jgi:hypothetical protein
MEMAYENIIVSNRTNNNVHVKNRHGYVKTYPSNRDNEANEVSIFTIVCIRNPYSPGVQTLTGSDNYCQDFLEKNKHNHDTLLDEIKIVYAKAVEYGRDILTGAMSESRFMAGQTDNPGAPRDLLYLVTKIAIPVSILTHHKTIYVNNKSLVVSIRSLADLEEHPALTDTHPLVHVKERVENNLYGVLLVDNHSQFSERFAFLFGDVIKISPIQDPTRADGLYIFGKVDGVPTKNYLSPDELNACKYIWKSREAAMSGGDVASELGKALAEAQHKNKMEEARMKAREIELSTALNNSKMKQDELKLALETSLSTIKIKEAELSARLNERKYQYEDVSRIRQDYYDSKLKERSDHYDELSKRRSSTMEVVKTTGAVVAALAGITLVVAKAMGK